MFLKKEGSPTYCDIANYASMACALIAVTSISSLIRVS